MALPSTTSPILPQDYTVTPFRVTPLYEVKKSDEVTTNRYGLYFGSPTPVSSSKAANDPKNSDGSFKHIIWKSYFNKYYRYPFDVGNNLTDSDPNVTTKYLAMSSSFISLPYTIFGEGIRKGSFKFTSGSVVLIDDGNENLIDESISTDDFYSKDDIVIKWDFSDLFMEFRRGFGEFDDEYFPYDTDYFANDEDSYAHECFVGETTHLQNGTSLSFRSGSYLSTVSRKELQFDQLDDFIVSMWVKPSEDGSILSKRGVYPKEVHKAGEDGIQKVNKPVSIYPYDIYVDSGQVHAKRSDGIRTVHLSGSVEYDEWNLVTFYKYGDKVALRYRSGSAYESMVEADPTGLCVNKHYIHFGATDLNSDDGFEGNLAQVIFAKTKPWGTFHPESGSVATGSYVPHNYPYNTNVVGNVFYKYGDVVISSHYDKYNDILDGDWSISYNGQKTIYQYECLARIRKGDFNLTTNPSARKSYKSDELINEFTASLTPYATSVGLYNDHGDLIAIGKLAQPLKMRDDVDINVLVRWDL